jgi:SAM-dependent methyltransferase
MSLIGKYHQKFIYNRRVHVLSQNMIRLIPRNAKVLDVGCGDGLISRMIADVRKDITIKGVDVLLREKSFIDVKLYDGKKLPFEDDEFDAVIFIDVLHHTTNQMELLKEARRVTSNCLIIKDHLNNGWIDNKLLTIMDSVGNKRFGVNLTYEYWSLDQWKEAFKKINLSVSEWITELNLYQFPLNLAFDRKLHFISKLEKE